MQKITTRGNFSATRGQLWYRRIRIFAVFVARMLIFFFYWSFY